MKENFLLFYSTNGRAERVSFREALLKGLAPDKGLYMPQRIPVLTAGEMAGFADQAYHEIADVVCGKFLQGQIPENDLATLIKEAYDFPVPLERVDPAALGLRRLVLQPQTEAAELQDWLAARWGLAGAVVVQEGGRGYVVFWVDV